MKMARIICEKCKKECEKPSKEINRQIKQGRTKFYCSLSCSTSNLKTTTEKIKSNCLFCGKEIDTTTHKKHKKCCNKNCAVKYSQSFVKKENKIIGLRNYYKNIPKILPKIRNFTCVMCGKQFQKTVDNWTYKNNPHKTCSDICYRARISQSSRTNPNCGGTHGYKRFKYKGFTMDSTWEVDVAKWMDEKDITWDRSQKKYVFLWIDGAGHQRKYFPDFYLPQLNVYLDPKNDYYLKRDLPKLTQVIDKYKIKLFYGRVDVIKKNIDNVIHTSK